MESRSRIAPDFRFLFKPLPDVRNGGCHVTIWLPEVATASSGPLPLAMMSHGGGWIIGAADSVPYNQVRYFHQHGIAVASFEYRHLPHVHMKEIREDLIDAYHYVQKGVNQDLREAGTSATIDGTRCSFMGWSAGGGNTLWVASDVTSYIKQNGKDSLPPFRAVISTYPLSKLDPIKGTRAQWDEYLASHPVAGKAWKELLAGECNTTFKVELEQAAAARASESGQGEKEAENLAPSHTDTTETTPTPFICPRLIIGGALIHSGSLPSILLNQDPPFPPSASPINGLSADFPPTCIVAASEDKLIPIDHSMDVYSKLQDLGVESLLVTCKGMEHGEAECLPGNNWMDSWWEEAIRPSLDFAIERMRA